MLSTLGTMSDTIEKKLGKDSKKPCKYNKWDTADTDRLSGRSELWAWLKSHSRLSRSSQQGLLSYLTEVFISPLCPQGPPGHWQHSHLAGSLRLHPPRVWPPWRSGPAQCWRGSAPSERTGRRGWRIELWKWLKYKTAQRLDLTGLVWSWLSNKKGMETVAMERLLVTMVTALSM